MSSPERIEAAAERSGVVREALALACQTHAGQARQTGAGETPFIDHPLAVAERLAAAGRPDEVVAAALLHDTVEHGEVEPAELRERFGAQVAAIVAALTEDAGIESYKERKDELRDRVAAAGGAARDVYAADKLANVAVLREAYGAVGEEVDSRLPVPLERKLRTWERDLEMLAGRPTDGATDGSPGEPLVEQLAAELEALREQRAGLARLGLN